MKKLLTLTLLLSILFIRCSKNDDNYFDVTNLTPTQKDKLLVGQWTKEINNNKGMLIKFNENKTFEKYEIVDCIKKQIKKTQGIYKTGSYGFLNYGFIFGDQTTLLFIHDKNTIGFLSEENYIRDQGIYTEVN